MTSKQWLYFSFTLLLAVVLAAITAYVFRGKRKRRMEEPKYRMLDEDDERDKPRR